MMRWGNGYHRERRAQPRGDGLHPLLFLGMVGAGTLIWTVLLWLVLS